MALTKAQQILAFKQRVSSSIRNKIDEYSILKTDVAARLDELADFFTSFIGGIEVIDVTGQVNYILTMDADKKALYGNNIEYLVETLEGDGKFHKNDSIEVIITLDEFNNPLTYKFVLNNKTSRILISGNTSDNTPIVVDSNLPAGGTLGQYLVKSSNVDFDAFWQTLDLSAITNAITSINEALNDKADNSDLDSKVDTSEFETAIGDLYDIILNTEGLSVNPRGEWSEEVTDYKFLDLVTNSGNSYLVKHKGIVPTGTLITNTTYFTKYADRGKDFTFDDFTPEEIELLQQPAIEAAEIADTATTNANTATSEANTAKDNANTATANANNATSAANTATSEANDARDEALAAAIVANGARGWQPEIGLESDGTIREVQKLIRWVGGTGDIPIDYVGKYIGSSGFVNTKAEAKNVKGNNSVMNSTSITSNIIATGAKTFILVTPIDLVVGQVAKAYSLADPNNYVCGYIFSITPTEIVITVSEVGGIGTKTDWVIVSSAFRGIPAITTPNLSFGQLAAKYTAGNGSAQAVDTVGFYMGSNGKFYNALVGISGGGYNVGVINNPAGGVLLSWGAGITGAICIKLPGILVSTVLFTGSIFIGGTLASSFIITVYPSSMTYANTAIFIGGQSYPVRWYANGTDVLVYIGDLTSVWANTNITIEKVQTALSDFSNYAQGWVLTFETAFLGTLKGTRTLSQTLPKPGLQYPMEDYNAASGTETDVTNATSPLQAFQNIEKKLGNRYTKPQSDVRYFPSTTFTTAGTGILLKTDIATNININVIVKLIGNGASGSNPIDITIQLLQNAAGVISRTNAISLGYSFPIYAFSLSGFLHIWFNPAVNCSIGVNIYNSGGFNQPFIYHSFLTTEEVKPTTGVTNEVLITPKKALLNDISGLTLANEILYNGVERYTDNTTQKVVLVRNIADGLFRTGNATDTGAIKIALPTAAFGSGYQPVIKGLIYFYDALLATNRSCEFMITANTGSFENGASAVFIGANAPKFPVRWYLDADGTTRYIAIGELTQDWSYLSFSITDVLNGINGATIASTSSGYNISLITAFTGTIQQLRTETLPKPGLSNTALRGLTLQNDILHGGTESGANTTRISQALFPPGGMYKGVSNETGAIKICNPNFGVFQSMTVIKGTIYFFDEASATNRTCDFIISFYTSSMERGYSAVFLGANAPKFPVRWFTDGVVPYIAIGELTQTWSFLGVVISNVKASYTGGNLSLSSYNWQISLITSFTGTQSAIKTETLPRPGLGNAVEEFNAASGLDIPLTNAMSPLQMFQNLDKSRDNRYTKAQSLAASNPLSFYYNGVPAGLLITTEILISGSAQAFLINIKSANQSSSIALVDIYIQGVVSTGSLTNVTGFSKAGYFYDDITLLQIGGKLCIWFPTTGNRVFFATAFVRPNSVATLTNENKVSALVQSTGTQPAQDGGSFTPQIVPITNVVLTKNKPLNVSSSSTLSLANQADYLRYTANATLTIPTNAVAQFPIGTRIDLTVLATFTLTIVASGGVTVNGLSNIVGYGKGYIRKIGTDEWDLVKNDATKILNTGLASNLILGDGTSKAVSDFVLATQKGAANGVVPLNASTLIDQVYLPSYVDDIIEGYKSGANFYKEVGLTTLITGETGKIYVDLTTGQNSKQYRWSGSAYIQITNGLIASTNDVSEGGSNLYFTVARVLATVISGFSAVAGVVANTDTILQAINKIVGNIALKADISSPTFTGTPSLPTGTTGVTQTAGDNSTKLATTAYVKTAVDAVSSSVTLLKGSTTANGTDIITNRYKDITVTGVTVGDVVNIEDQFRLPLTDFPCWISAKVTATNTIRIYFSNLQLYFDGGTTDAYSTFYVYTNKSVENPNALAWTINYTIIK